MFAPKVSGDRTSFSSQFSHQIKAQNQQNKYLATKLIKMIVINLLLHKILCFAFGAWPSGPPPSYPSMSHLNIMKNLGSGLDPLPPFGTMSHISVFFLFEGIPKFKMSWVFGRSHFDENQGVKLDFDLGLQHRVCQEMYLKFSFF